MILPLITLIIDNNMWGLPNTGNLTYQYLPFQNLHNPRPGTQGNSLTNLTINSFKSGIDITKPLTIDTEVAYDDSINLVITDEVNPPKIVNSRFYQTSTMTYEVADRKGNLDTNIYSEENFKIEANLIKSIRTITSVEFLGIKDGGTMKVGNYTFYFKLADADGNETDFVAESGKIICHIGTVNSPKSIRGGQQDEISNKIIKFKLKNLDLAYDYINIYYTRSTGDGDQAIVKTYKINDKFKITNNDVEVSLTGYENHEEIALQDINIQYSVFDSVKTLANCQNITFAGNITNDYNLFRTLEKYSLFITPDVAYDTKGIGNLNELYEERYINNGYEYYNANNVYYKLGYWDEEIYRIGIVYILNNYTLSPVFNIRGKKIINGNTAFTTFDLNDSLSYTDDYILENSSSDNPENVKGVFKIDLSDLSQFNYTDTIKPIGIKFTFNGNVLNGNGSSIEGLAQLTKGFFIVRQKRIPTILAQSVGIATSKKARIPVIRGSKLNGISDTYFAESFLTKESDSDTAKLQSSLFPIWEVYNNALLCPEAHIRRELFNSFFNSSEYTLKQFKYTPSSSNFICQDDSNNFALEGLMVDLTVTDSKNVELTLIEPGIELIKNNSGATFSSKAGDAIIPYKHLDGNYGNYEDPSNTAYVSDSATKIRGEFNTFIGLNKEITSNGKYYNILQKDYNFETQWREYFRIRFNDSSSFFPISDRIIWSQLQGVVQPDLNVVYKTDTFFRGDCYINTYTHRIHWNFIDPDMPTNKKVIDIFNWAKNFKVLTGATSVIISDSGVSGTSTLTYNKLLLLFTYKSVSQPAWKDDTLVEEPNNGLLQPDSKKFKKYSEINGLFGAEKLNRPDINAVPLGHWATFKICSNINLAMRDLDWTRPAEEVVFKQKRGFYPLQSLDASNPLPDSNIINNGISKTVSDKYYYEIPNVPFIKTNFVTRIYFSNLLKSSTFANGNRVFEATSYEDYTREHGSLIKLIEWYGRLIGVMEHGVIIIPVNERAAMKNENGENVYINTDTILPKNPKVLSNTFGSIWPESIIKTSKFVYGIDTIGKKIWRTNGDQFECISDMKIQKFLNDNIKLLESEKDRTVNVNFVKTHYNAFKQDVLFTFKYNDVAWNLCWNELTEKWVTQYTWFPEFSENINNIFYTFANQSRHLTAQNKLYKHGFAGTQEELGNIKPTKWYDEQHPFEYEVIVNSIPGVQKVFDNLKIISNFAEPDSFYYEVVGEGFDWYKYKDLIMKLNNTALAIVDGVTLTTVPINSKVENDVKTRYKQYLVATPSIKKLPYFYAQSFDVNNSDSFFRDRGPLVMPFNMSELRDSTIREHNKTKEKLVNVYQKGANIKKYGRMRGNMDYLEDAWDIQIYPITFQYAYVVEGVIIEGQDPIYNLIFTPKVEMKIRDKYLKVRIKYSGTQYAIINGIKTLFTISYA